MNSGVGGSTPSVAVIGGGLAGMAAAVALGSVGCRVDLFEARRSLGGRAASFRDPASGELVDHCQHVSMGCCTNLADFCRRTGIADCFRRDRVLHFIGPDGRHYPFQSASALPAPLHLAPSFLQLDYLSHVEKFQIGHALWKLLRAGEIDDRNDSTILQWLRDNGQTSRAIERFWSVILISALGEQLDRASLAAARKVLVDGFMAAREAYVIEVPRAPLGTLYGERLQAWFAAHNVSLHLNASVRQVFCDSGPVVVGSDERQTRPDFAVVALPWSKVGGVVSADIAAGWPWLEALTRLEAAPITGVHLWFDRPIMSLPHAVLVGRLSHWIFNRASLSTADDDGEHYYQVVVSALRELAGRDRDAIVAEVCGELASIWPRARAAKLLRSRVVTEHGAVFSVRPGLESLRPAQQTSLPGLLLAGDWTATGWPATMEGAVRSGYLAAEAIVKSLGGSQRFLVPDLPRGLLARLLIGK